MILTHRFLYELRIEEIPYIMERGSSLYSWQEIFCAALPAVFVAPFIEEIVFRLGMFGFARSRAGKLYGLFLSSVLFAFSHHGGIARFLETVIFSIVAVILLWKTRNILYPMLFHLSVNFWITILGIADRLISRRYGKIGGDSMMSFFYCMTCMATVVIETRTLFTEIIELLKRLPG